MANRPKRPKPPTDDGRAPYDPGPPPQLGEPPRPPSGGGKTPADPPGARGPGQRLKEIRERRRLTQAALADRLDATSQWISLLENGHRNFTEPVMRRLAMALDCEPADFLAELGDPLAGSPALREPDVARYEAGAPQMAAQMQAIHPEIRHGEIWEVRSRVLNLNHVDRGDLALVDLDNHAPPDGAIVLAQHYTADGMSAETVLRILRRPYLIARSDDPRFDLPILLDGRAATIMGTVVSICRNTLPTHQNH